MFLGILPLVICLKKQHLRRLKILAFLLIFGIAVFTGGYLYFNSLLNKKVASVPQESIPYYEQKPDNTTLLLEICTTQILLNLDFEQEILNILYPEDSVTIGDVVFGYEVNHIIKADYSLAEYFTDAVQGIELTVDGQTLRYTGVQIYELLNFSYVSDELGREILAAIISGIGQNSITDEELLYVVKNYETDLKFSDCFMWTDYLQKLCRFPRFVN